MENTTQHTNPRTRAIKLLLLADAGAVSFNELAGISPARNPDAAAEHVRQQARLAACRYPELAAKAKRFVLHNPVGARRVARAEIKAMQAGAGELTRGIRQAEQVFDGGRSR